jgi:hypothetical protein
MEAVLNLSKGHRITPFVEHISGFETTAKFVLVIEKDTTFMRRKCKYTTTYKLNSD